MFPRSKDDRTVLFYCAFELRCAIERIFYECLSNIRREKLTKKESEFWSARNLKAAVLAIDPDFEAKVDFLNLMLEARGISHRFTVPDLKRLSKDYGRLHHYLHAQRTASGKTADPRWWDEFRGLIEEIHDYAWPLCSEPKTHIEFNEVAMRFFEGYKRGRMTPDRAIAAMKVGLEGFEAAAQYRNFYD